MSLERSAIRLLRRLGAARHLGAILQVVVRLAWGGLFVVSRADSAEPATEATVTAVKNGDIVMVTRAGASVPDKVTLGQVLYTGDLIRTGEHSRATLRLRDDSIVHLDELTELRLGVPERHGIVELLRGVLSFFHRDEPGSLEVRSGGVSAIVKGTEFAFTAQPDGTVLLTLREGAVTLANAVGSRDMRSGDQFVVVPGQAPRPTAVLSAGSVEGVQWLLYYPAVLDLLDLELSADARSMLAEPLKRYAEGDLLGALASYPPGRTDSGPDEQPDLLRRALIEALSWSWNVSLRSQVTGMATQAYAEKVVVGRGDEFKSHAEVEAEADKRLAAATAADAEG